MQIKVDAELFLTDMIRKFGKMSKTPTQRLLTLNLLEFKLLASLSHHHILLVQGESQPDEIKTRMQNKTREVHIRYNSTQINKKNQLNNSLSLRPAQPQQMIQF